jgi:hypothetical protein
MNGQERKVKIDDLRDPFTLAELRGHLKLDGFTTHRDQMMDGFEQLIRLDMQDQLRKLLPHETLTMNGVEYQLIPQFNLDLFFKLPEKKS